MYFSNGVRSQGTLMVKSGKKTLIWQEACVDKMHLKLKYPNLYNMCEDPLALVWLSVALNIDDRLACTYFCHPTMSPIYSGRSWDPIRICPLPTKCKWCAELGYIYIYIYTILNCNTRSGTWLKTTLPRGEPHLCRQLACTFVLDLCKMVNWRLLRVLGLAIYAGFVNLEFTVWY
jgi:hypothetical protein